MKIGYPNKEIEIWSQDESRMGLQPIIRRMWAIKGERPIAKQERKYQWLYAYSFVRPYTGEGFWLLMPTVNIALMSLALKEFSCYHDPRNNKIIVLLLDRAGWHMSDDLEVPKNIKLFPLPPYTPELQPTECVNPLLKESIANKSFKDLDELELKLSSRCRWLLNNPKIVKGAVGFDWIQKIEAGTD